MQILLAFLGGIIPVIIWLWFWLKEDRLHPEPKKCILMTFLIGMVTALTIIYFEKFIIENTVRYSLFSFFLLSSTEELAKFFAVYVLILRKNIYDEPVDALIYLITVALGFAGMENILYIFNVLDGNLSTQTLITMSNMRFVGATILHTASSGIIGLTLGLSFYRKKMVKVLYLLIGVILSIALHTGFNFFIMKGIDGGILKVFSFTWIVIILILLVTEKVKNIKFKK